VTRLGRILHAVSPSLERRLWAAEQLRRAAKADAIIASTGKSGRTWLRVMISHLYHRRFGIPADQIIAFDNLHCLNPAIPKIFFGFGRGYLPPAWPWQAPMPVPRDRPLVFLVRDPRDVTVSFHLQLNKRATQRELAHKGEVGKRRHLSIFDFATDEIAGVPRVIRLYNDWNEQLASNPRAHLLRYEALRAEPEAQLAAVMAHLGQPFATSDIRAAVAFASFASMQAAEQRGYFATDRLRPATSADPGASKVRRGAVGGYREHFSASEGATIDRLVSEHLVPDWGYKISGTDLASDAALHHSRSAPGSTS